MPWAKGQSGNVHGRPKGFRGVAGEIMRRTGDGTALIDYAMQVWLDPAQPHDRRWEAFQWLSDRGMGRAVNVSEMSVAVEQLGSGLPANWDALPSSERERYLDQLVAGQLPAGSDS